MYKFQKKLRNWLFDNQLTQREFASMAGISPVQLSTWLSNRHPIKPTRKNAYKLSQATNHFISPTDIDVSY